MRRRIPGFAVRQVIGGINGRAVDLLAAVKKSVHPEISFTDVQINRGVFAARPCLRAMLIRCRWIGCRAMAASITPLGFNALADGSSSGVARSSFGNAFFTGTGEFGLRVNQSLYIDTFFEGGNVWDSPRQFDPTRLFRSFGFGAAIVSPLGPIGIDLGYGLDRLDTAGNPAPGWKLHFKLGQFF